MNPVSIHECLDCKNEFALLFSTNEKGESINVEPCPACEADYKKVVLAKKRELNIVEGESNNNHSKETLLLRGKILNVSKAALI